MLIGIEIKLQADYNNVWATYGPLYTHSCLQGPYTRTQSCPPEKRPHFNCVANIKRNPFFIDLLRECIGCRLVVPSGNASLEADIVEAAPLELGAKKSYNSPLSSLHLILNQIANSAPSYTQQVKYIIVAAKVWLAKRFMTNQPSQPGCAETTHVH